MAQPASAFAGQSKPHHSRFCKLLKSISNQHQTWRLFSDFCELAAMSLSNVVVKSEAREERWRAIARQYTADEMRVMHELLAVVVEGLESESDRPSCDFLGEVFQELELASHWHGQYFTPWHLALLLGQLVGRPDSFEEPIRRRGWIKALEPACGAGVMILGLAAAMRDAGLNPHTQLHVTAVDVDATAAHMTFIQLALWHIPAVVVIGDSLSLACRYQMWTPAHFLGMWDLRLRAADIIDAVQELQGNDPAALQALTTDLDAALVVPLASSPQTAGERDERDPLPAPIVVPRPQMKLF